VLFDKRITPHIIIFDGTRAIRSWQCGYCVVYCVFVHVVKTWYIFICICILYIGKMQKPEWEHIVNEITELWIIYRVRLSMYRDKRTAQKIRTSVLITLPILWTRIDLSPSADCCVLTIVTMAIIYDM
jgi:hypothetical protein